MPQQSADEGALLTLCPLLPQTGLEATPARRELLAQARALLLAPSSLPVADLREQPARWEELKLMQRAHAAGLPILAWGNGAALLGRSLGAQVTAGKVRGEWIWTGEALWPAQPFLSYTGEYCSQVRGMEVLATVQGVPALWSVAGNLALLDPQPSAEQLATLLAKLPAPLRRPATPLEALGGSERLRAVLEDFYAQCRTDELLGPTFAQVNDWPHHMRQVQRFWETMLGEPERGAWRGNLNHIHAPLRVTGAQLERWLELLSLSAQRHLTPQGAELLLGKARAMRARLSQPRKAPGAN